MPPAASAPACAQDRAAWPLYVSVFCLLATYQPVCIVTLAVSNEIDHALNRVTVLVGIYPWTLWSARFPRRHSHHSALREFAKHIRPLTIPVHSFQIFTMPVAGAQSNEPMIIRVLFRCRARAEKPFFEDRSKELQLGGDNSMRFKTSSRCLALIAV